MEEFKGLTGCMCMYAAQGVRRRSEATGRWRTVFYGMRVKPLGREGGGVEVEEDKEVGLVGWIVGWLVGGARRQGGDARLSRSQNCQKVN